VSAEAAKYAKPERERRFVLSEVPEGATDPREILDLYVVGTRVRVRSVRSGDDTQYKLGQKIRPRPDDPGLVMHTTLYLSADEYEVFAALRHHQLRKTRHTVELSGRALSVDAFHDVLEGLVLAEVDLGGDDPPLPGFEPPAYCITEVSGDERFTGGHLAVADRSTVDRALEEVSGLHLPS
jgi:CYTH domain-containing protein